MSGLVIIKRHLVTNWHTFIQQSMLPRMLSTYSCLCSFLCRTFSSKSSLKIILFISELNLGENFINCIYTPPGVRLLSPSCNHIELFKNFHTIFLINTY